MSFVTDLNGTVPLVEDIFPIHNRVSLMARGTFEQLLADALHVQAYSGAKKGFLVLQYLATEGEPAQEALQVPDHDHVMINIYNPFDPLVYPGNSGIG